MKKNRTYHKKKTLIVFCVCVTLMAGLAVRLTYLMVVRSEYYTKKAQELHERERDIKAARGKIVDRKGVVLADNQAVCTVSVIHSQVRKPEKVKRMLVKELELSPTEAEKRVEKVSSIERVRTNVPKEIGDRIREYHLAGVKVDEDFKRFYPYEDLASRVLGFTGRDNQGIIGLEVAYDSILQGTNGRIMTTTDARGVELGEIGERRIEAIPGQNLHISMDYNIQRYIQQAAEKVMEEKQADGVSILLLNPQNGEIYGMTNVPEFNLNEPFSLQGDVDLQGVTEKKRQELLNQMWRNVCINDTYEPGSTFKIITAAAGLEEGVVSLDDTFFCPGYRVVEDRRIHCHKRTGHGSESFLQGAENSCNPVFIEVGLRIGTENYYKYFRKFEMMKKTGIDLPGEAEAIMHKKDEVGQVELATIAFGQSFQITPIQLAATAASIVNGGYRITPHLGVAVRDDEGRLIKSLHYPRGKRIVTKKTSETMRYILEKVVAEGSGKNAAVPGYAVGGKTATSQTLPRSANRYISSFLGFAPADDPRVLGLCIIYHPKGVYYGGTIAAPVMQDIFANVLPYLNIKLAQ